MSALDQIRLSSLGAFVANERHPSDGPSTRGWRLGGFLNDLRFVNAAFANLG